MHLASFALLAALAAIPASVQAASSPVPTTVAVSPTPTQAGGSCVTVTTTNGGDCPVVSHACVLPQCLLLSTITLSCGCPSIYHSSTCITGCPVGCQTSYDTVYIPCAMTPPSGGFTSSTMSPLTNSSEPSTAPSTSMTASSQGPASSTPTPTTTPTTTGPKKTTTTSVGTSTTTAVQFTGAGNRVGLSVAENALAGLFAVVLGLL